MYISYNKYNIIKAVSNKPIKIVDHILIETDQLESENIIGKKLILGNQNENLRVALVCNWGDRCGIATYTAMLVEHLRPLVGEIRIFAEVTSEPDIEQDSKDNVERCWKRGTSMIDTVNRIKEWNPDITFVQHEFGIFPKATYFLKFLELLDQMPYVITLHSVYEHLDKTICTAYIRNMIVHSGPAKESLARNGHLNNVYVIHHGCVEYPNHDELWNIFQNDFCIIQFGFGFNYKGVDCAIDAVQHLKEQHPEKFKDIFFCYMCTESPHTRQIQNDYYNYLNSKVEEFHLQDNVVIVRGFLSEQYICNFLRTAKLAIFPYKNDETNIVYGASGAIRKAMANGIPIIASDCHLFDDMEGTVPRIHDHYQLADEIDKIFSDSNYKNDLVKKNLEFVQVNNWNNIALQHVNVFKQVINQFEENVIRISNFEFVL